MLRAAALWLAVLAALTAILAVVALIIGPPLAGPEPALLLGVATAVLLASALASLRASNGHRIALAAMFALGVGGLIVLLAPALERLLPWNGGLYGVSLVELGVLVRWPQSALLLAPAFLLTVGTVRRWCVLGGEGNIARRSRLARRLTAAIGLPVIALAVLVAAAPACGPGRTCIPTANLSLVLPAGWSQRPADSGQLFVAGPQDDSDSVQISIEDGASILGFTGTLDEVESDVVRRLGERDVFVSVSGLTAERIVLPVGPAVRIRYASARSFIITYHQYTISEWFLLDGRLLVIGYMEAFGEGTPRATSPDRADFRLVRESLRSLSG